MIEKRLVFVFPGFEPMPITAHMDRFARAAARTAPLWDTRLAIEPTDRRAETEAATHRGVLRALCRQHVHSVFTEAHASLCIAFAICPVI